MRTHASAPASGASGGVPLSPVVSGGLCEADLPPLTSSPTPTLATSSPRARAAPMPRTA